MFNRQTGPLLGILLVVLVAWIWLRPNGPQHPFPQSPFPQRPVAATLAPKQHPKPTVDQFSVAGPDGKTLTARFYGLERLQPSGDDPCPHLRERMRALPSDKGEGAKLLFAQACAGARGEDGEILAEHQRLGQAFILGVMLMQIDDRRSLDPVLLVTLMRRQLSLLRTSAEPKTVAEMLNFYAGNLSEASITNSLALRRFQADLARLQADYCAISPLWEHCRLHKLVEAGEEYARLGRLETDEQHFSDMTAVLDEAEILARQTQDKSVRLDKLDDIASAYGYAGEAGRNVALLRRSLDIAEKNLAALEPTKDGDDKYAYGTALTMLGSALSRLSAHEGDQVAASKRAIATHERAIAHQRQYFPDDQPWASHINLATDQRDLFALTWDAAWIRTAIGHARIAHGMRSGDRRDAMAFYVDARLGQMLAWQARHDTSLDKDQRRRLAEEARPLLDGAAATFRQTNAQAYLRFITSAQDLLKDPPAPQ